MYTLILLAAAAKKAGEDGIITKLFDFDFKQKLLELFFEICSNALTEIQKFILDSFVLIESAVDNPAIAPWYKYYVLAANILGILVFACYSAVTTWEITFNLGGALARVKELFPRFLIGMVMVNGSIWFCEFIIVINNLMINALLDGAGGRDWLERLHYNPTPGTLAGVNVALIVVLLAAAVLLGLVGQSRIILVYVLTLLAPFSCLLWIIPETSGWFWMWLKEMIAWTFAELVQLTALVIGFAVLLGHRSDIYGKVGDFFAAFAIYTVMAAVPFFVRQWVGAMFVKLRVSVGTVIN